MPHGYTWACLPCVVHSSKRTCFCHASKPIYGWTFLSFLFQLYMRVCGLLYTVRIRSLRCIHGYIFLPNGTRQKAYMIK